MTRIKELQRAPGYAQAMPRTPTGIDRSHCAKTESGKRMPDPGADCPAGLTTIPGPYACVK